MSAVLPPSQSDTPGVTESVTHPPQPPSDGFPGPETLNPTAYTSVIQLLCE